MKKLTLAISILTLIGIAAGPAQADRYSYKSLTAQAFWYTEEPTGAHSFTETIWYVGVYRTEEQGTFSDLYQEVDDCVVRQNGKEHCTQVSFKVGYTDLSGAGDVFRVTDRSLASAHLEATYRLRTYDENGNPIGDAEPYHAVTDWTGNGELNSSYETYTFEDNCYRISSTTKGQSRPSIATGSLNAANLGSTDDAFIARNFTQSREQYCDEGRHRITGAP